MRGITFGSYHSFDSFGMILSTKEIGSPNVKTRKIEIDGADGALDMTDYFGDAKYDDVTLKFSFTKAGTQTQLIALYTAVKNALHGKKMRIVLDDDPTFYYVGRCYVSSFTNSKNIGVIDIECDCEPYKYKALQTIVTNAISGSGTIILTNGRKRAVPSITTDETMTITFGSTSVTRNAGTFRIPELELVQGDNTITVTGTGTITFAWQEGEL